MRRKQVKRKNTELVFQMLPMKMFQGNTGDQPGQMLPIDFLVPLTRLFHHLDLFYMCPQVSCWG